MQHHYLSIDPRKCTGWEKVRARSHEKRNKKTAHNSDLAEILSSPDANQQSRTAIIQLALCLLAENGKYRQNDQRPYMVIWSLLQYVQQASNYTSSKLLFSSFFFLSFSFLFVAVITNYWPITRYPIKSIWFCTILHSSKQGTSLSIPSWRWWPVRMNGHFRLRAYLVLYTLQRLPFLHQSALKGSATCFQEKSSYSWNSY